MNKIKLYFAAHKIISSVILIAIVALVYFGYKKFTSVAGESRYLTAKVEIGTIITSVSGTGQVSSLNQIDIKPKVSGDVIYITAKNGDALKAGSLIAQIDTKDAQKSVRDAEISLESAKIALEKLKIQKSSENMNADLIRAYDDGFNVVSDTFLDLPSIITGLDTVLAEDNLSENSARINGKIAQNFRDLAESSYYATEKSFTASRKFYRTLNYNSSPSDIEKIIEETYQTTKLVSEAIKNLRNFVDYMAEDATRSTDFVSTQDTLSTYTNTNGGHFDKLVTIKTTIQEYKDAFPDSSLDIKSEEITVQQKENALQDAKDKLADYFIRSPFAGTITAINIKKGDTVSSSTAVATIITTKQIAEISLNEIDVAKIKIGQKTTLTFDAVPNLTISGNVAEIDSVGTVSQGVVTYNVKIDFDTEDERVKPGMSVSSAIVTDVKQNVLVVPNSAVKSLPSRQAGQAGTSYIEMFDAPLAPPTDGLIGSLSKITPNKIPVEVGLFNDSQTEIISGIKEGDEIVTRTIVATTATTTTTPSIFGSPANRGSGNSVRIPAR